MNYRKNEVASHIDGASTGALTRRQFTASSVIAASGMASALPAVSQVAPATAMSRLAFDWVSVPVGADVGDARRDFSADEINFLARRFNVLSIEKAMGGTGNTEQGFLTAAKALKAANPKVAVLYYWNSLDFFPNQYQGLVSLDPSFVMPGTTSWYNLDNPQMRKWWVDQAVNMARNNEVDGIFLDSLTTAHKAFANTGSALLLIKELRAELNKLGGVPRLIFYNMGPWIQFTDASGTLHPLLQLTDGVLFEDFYRRDLGRIATAAAMAAAMRGMQVAAAKGKAVIFKTWPSFSFITGSSLDATAYSDVVRQARAEISFPLAAFLVAADRYCYLQYSWGWNHTSLVSQSARFDHGVFIRTQDNRSTTVDPTWYPELRRALGSPRGAATVVGYKWTRTFAHAVASCDLAAATGTITWNSAPNYFPRG